MIRYLEFIHLNDCLIAVKQPEELFAPGSLVEENFHENQSSFIVGRLIKNFDKDVFAECFYLGGQKPEEIISHIQIGRDVISENDRKKWLKMGLVTKEQIAPDYIPPITKRKLVYQKGEPHSNEWHYYQRIAALEALEEKKRSINKPPLRK